jgi:hypothetical protein
MWHILSLLMHVFPHAFPLLHSWQHAVLEGGVSSALEQPSVASKAKNTNTVVMWPIPPIGL